LTVTSMVLAILVPLAFDAVTLIVPPERPVVTVMLLVVFPAVMTHPAGRVQL